MKDYAEALGGRCHIESSPRRGTSIHILLPDPAGVKSLHGVASQVSGSDDVTDYSPSEG